MGLSDLPVGAPVGLHPCEIDEGLLEALVVVVPVDAGGLQVCLRAEQVPLHATTAVFDLAGAPPNRQLTPDHKACNDSQED